MCNAKSKNVRSIRALVDPFPCINEDLHVNLKCTISFLHDQGLPYLEKKDNWEQFEGNDQYEGYCADLAKQIAENIPFNYRIKPVGDDKFGAMEDDGTWNGMVGELIRKVSFIHNSVMFSA